MLSRSTKEVEESSAELEPRVLQYKTEPSKDFKMAMYNTDLDNPILFVPSKIVDPTAGYIVEEHNAGIPVLFEIIDPITRKPV
jgi:hypothetical protein